jgi:glycosyltransferase involved in cell wall biosynthesis
LARNEAERIPALIADLSKQTLFVRRDCRFEIHVVANGCTDDTVQVSRAALKRAAFDPALVRTIVHDLPGGGKANAWNEFVHRLAPDDTDIAFFLDGDILIPETFALEVIWQRLISTPGAVVAVDRSIKDIALQRPRNLVEWIIRACTGTADDPSKAIAGALYCVKFDIAQQITMPIGLPGEDGFLRAMLLTSSFTHDERIERHVYVPEARHIFEALRSIRAVFRHNVRLAIGTGINILLFKHFRSLRSKDVNLFDYTRDRNATDPAWINELVRNQARKSFFVIEPLFILRRLRPIRRILNRRELKRLPARLIGLAFDCAVFVAANMLMRRGAGAGYW